MQPTQDLLTVSRRPLDLEDYIDIVRRHKSWLIGPVFAALVVAVVVAFLWPDTFVSEASIQVVPPQVPDKLVPTIVGVDMSQRINTMAQAILSRPTLTNIIQSYGLYRSELRRSPMEDVIEHMRGRAIRLSPVQAVQNPGRANQISAFRLSFEYDNRMLAQKVTQDLVSRFVAENIRSRSTQSVQTTEFLREQLDSARKELGALENKLTEFRQRNAGRLPDELQSNLQSIRSYETQLAGANDAVSRIGQEKLLLEAQIRLVKDQADSMTSGADTLSATVKNDRLIQVDREILGLETLLSGMLERYRDTHPDVKRVQSQLGVLRKTRDGLLAQQEEAKPDPAIEHNRTSVKTRVLRDADATISRLQSQIQAKDLDLERRGKEQDQLKRLLNQYQARIEASPVMQQEYAQLTRDHELAKARYEDMNRKASMSQMATQLESQQQGEKLELLEPASLPETPAKPNRLMMVGIGVSLGVMLGVFTVGVREMKDTSLKSLKDARAYTNLPVLGTVPLLENDLVVRRKRRLVWLAWSAASMLGILAMTTSVLYYYSGRT
ncbi:MAG: GNVR domain-containing protein [Acidobacteriota bacterium]|mgnify:FL=1